MTRAQDATLIGTSLGFGVIQLDVTVVNVAVKQIGAAFGGGIAELQWVVGSYTLMFAALILAAGALGDRFGARRVLCAGFVVFVAASMACGLAPGIAALITARAVQGIGAALLGSCSLALLNHTFTDPRRRARAIGQWAAGASAALSGGPVVGGLLIASLGWRSIFFINGPIGLAGLWLVWRYAPRTPPAPERRVDVPGAATAVVALAAFAVAVIKAGQHGFANPWVLAGLAAAALAVAAFVWIQARTAHPMLPLALFRQRGFAAPVLTGFLVNVCFYGLIFLLSLLFQEQLGLSALRAGLAFLPMTAAILAANLVSSRVSAAVGARGTILAGLAVMAAGLRRAAGRPGHRLPGPAGAAAPARRRARVARPADDRPRAVQRRTVPLRCRLRRANRLQAGGQPARRRPLRRPGREPLLPRPAHRPVDQHRGPRHQHAGVPAADECGSEPVIGRCAKSHNRSLTIEERTRSDDSRRQKALTRSPPKRRAVRGLALPAAPDTASRTVL